jgi:hypothetical protein
MAAFPSTRFTTGSPKLLKLCVRASLETLPAPKCRSILQQTAPRRSQDQFCESLAMHGGIFIVRPSIFTGSQACQVFYDVIVLRFYKTKYAAIRNKPFEMQANSDGTVKVMIQMG